MYDRSIRILIGQWTAFLSGYQAERNNLLGILEEREESL